MEIIKTEHCLLCEHQSHTVKHGVYCSITNNKPEFDKTCNIKRFGKILEENSLEKSVELKMVEQTKVDTLGHLVIFFTIGIVVIYFGYFLIDRYGLLVMDSDSSRGGAMAILIMLIIVLVGFGLIVFAIAPVNLYRRNLQIAKSNKEKLDRILDEYNLTYKLDLFIKKSWPANIEVYQKLNVHPQNKKGSHLL